MSLYLGDTLIAGSTLELGKPLNIGQIIQSTLPLKDAGLHLLDGAKILGGGIYDSFVNYIADLYDTLPKTSNVTKLGSLTDTDGVLSGFTTSNYAIIPNMFSPNTMSWEIVLKIKLNSLTSTNTISGITNQFIAFFVNPSGKLTFNVGNGSAWVSGDTTGITTLSVNTDYYIKLEYNGTTFKSYYSTNGTTWNQEASYTGSISMNGVNLGLGIGRTLSGPLDGTINLNSSYININGSRWWTGVLHNCFTDETTWQQYVDNYGVCGKFVYDSINNTVRLPKVTGFVEGDNSVSNLGDLVEAGLPNITGGSGLALWIGSSLSGAYYKGSTVTGQGWYNTDTENELRFDASKSSSVYGKSNTVQPQSVKVLYYIVIATSTKTSIEVDIDEIATDLNGKADTDLSNTTPVSSFASAMNSAGIRTVVETYHNGDAWYRIWSDGLYEEIQMGITTKGTPVQVTFLHTFTSVPYCKKVRYGVSNVTDSTSYSDFTALSTTGFSSNQDNTCGTFGYYACGYIS